MSVATWGTEEAMNELESVMWRGENHPSHSTQGGVLMVLDGAPDFADIRAIHEGGVARFRRFRQRVAEPPVPVAPPAWVDDDAFDLDYHLRRTSLPAPGDERQLMELCQTLAVTPLDRRRPLWSGTFVEGLEGGRSAYFLTIHHCLMDGHASIALLGQLFTQDGPPDDRPDRPAPSAVAMVADGLKDRAKDSARLAGRLLDAGAAAVRKGPGESARFATSIGRVLAPPPEGESELMRGGTRTKWRYGILECGLEELKAAGKAAGGTLNDAYVAAVLGGLRRYHDDHGATMGDITITLPVSVRTEDHGEDGNRFAAAFVRGPSSIEDPTERIQALGARVREIRAEPALDFFSLLLPALNRLPAGVLKPLFIGMQERSDLTISNVAGLPIPVRLAGAELRRMYYFGPLSGSAVMSVLCSNNGTCCIGVNADGSVFDDPPALFACLQDGLDEVLALGRSS